MVFRIKAQREGNGPPLAEYCTNSRRFKRRAAGHHRDALRVSLSTSTDCVVPLDKELTIAGEARLAMNVDKLTELAIIILKEH